METSNTQELSVYEIKGGEILAKDLYLPNGTLFMSEGSVLKPVYRERFKTLGIDKIIVFSTEVRHLIEQSTEKIIADQCMDIVKATIDRFSYGIDAELNEIVHVAERIMKHVLSEPDVIYNVSKVRDRSERTYLHCINVAALSVLVGTVMKMQENRLRNMAIGALLHDIGLVYVPVDMSKIDRDTVDEATEKEIKRHVIYGYSVVEHENWLSSAAKEVIIGHHERVDGSGYPFHLTSDRMSLETKIVALCDEFDNMVYGIYTKRRKVNETMDYLISQAGIKFDFKVVQSFVDSVAAYPIGTIVRTNEGETAIVIRQNKGLPTRPVLKIRTAPSNSGFKPGDEKDLTKELTTFIQDSIG
ncbi:MAG: HD domain-containing protein [Lachnospiraceae bacterium]|nr:HD domain-containing protein [Lachnospiraceae bacterium]MBP5184088.1 HD domain-containing protein [Lachnospiraceae bacterium]